MKYKLILLFLSLGIGSQSVATLGKMASNTIKKQVTQQNARRALIQLKRNFYTADGHFFYDCELAE